MISVAEARETILRHVRRVAAERIGIGEALGRVLAEPVVASRAQPPFRASAMDGYALRSADTPGTLRVVGEASAGRSYDREVGPSECVRIFTGAPLPQGADAVLIQEDARREGELVEAPAAVVRGRHVRAEAIDFRAGAELVSKGTLLQAQHIALAAAAGCATLSAARKPRVAVLGGGDEIVPPHAEPSPAQIFDSTSYAVAALAQDWGAAVERAPPFRDSLESIAKAVGAAVENSDLTIVIGGASVGDYDHARSALKSLGADLLFEKVALRPGKPTWFALIKDKPILGLPGNPASAFVCARLFLRPLIEHMLGRDARASCTMTKARVRAPLTQNGSRETYLRARLELDQTGQSWAAAAENQDSSLLTVVAQSNALLVRAPAAPALACGDLADVLPY